VGWAVDPITKKGLFVEHEGESEVYVRDQIKKSLATLMETRGVDFGQINMQVTGITCYDKPVGATVVAVYQARPW
jgi:arginine decarboxylase